MITDHSALGNALGYVYQFDRATHRLFQSGVDVIEVGIEYLDDVSIHKTNDSKIHEQDKSTVKTGSPLSDRSVALWKTMHIWAELVLSDSTVLNNTEFHLVTNGTLTNKCLAQRINDTSKEKCSKNVCNEIRQMISTLRKDLVPFGRTLDKLDDVLLMKLLTKISVLDNKCSQFGGSLEEIQAIRGFDYGIKKSLFDQMSGWVKRKIIELAQAGMQPRILREEFDREFKGLVKKITVARLSAMVAPYNPGVDVSDYESHGFVKQLDWINVDDDLIREAILDYIQAQDTRVIWTDNNAVSESTLLLYQTELKKIWRTEKRRAYRQPYETDELKGEECLDLTMEQNSYIHGEPMPKTITSGNFHTLAHFDEEKDPDIGWHPQFKSLLKGLTE